MIDSARQKYDATCIINAELHIYDVNAINFFLFLMYSTISVFFVQLKDAFSKLLEMIKKL